MIDPAERVIYQLKVVLLGISPMIWRRVKVSSDSTIEDLHYTIQLAMGWEDIHQKTTGKPVPLRGAQNRRPSSWGKGHSCIGQCPIPNSLRPAFIPQTSVGG
ncbi:hypothetical protein QUB80_34040 [Chlorogloeopsis sp. ULAP01]|uniref:IS1096 element passenger TnpR family protein n=1 Tax=Chlorogloeopsis sp. ULAP01 TaxID=3056483 RepID=UPI0025AAEA95|nr:hypothetical protein [Chlorogloeopsis sp. ULAP01]MDM9384725.1 hypothetical protein [Chlorogloeopsis sp. ULAP01]MDM9385680.1 hypothetical protein [Chlorogloeopsis sp. ULAP01]